MKVWKKSVVAAALAVAVSYGTVWVGDTPTQTAAVYGLTASSEEKPPEGFWNRTKAWLGRHPALSGAVAGGVRGPPCSPGVGTFAVTGAIVGSTVGADEREAELHEKSKED